MHTAEVDLRDKAASNVAKYFSVTSRPASAHYCIDARSIYQCVQLSDTAYAAPGANHDGIQLELCTRAYSADWSNADHQSMLKLAAKLCSDLCTQFSLPIRFVSTGHLKQNWKGLTGHVQVSEAYHKSTHTDPGPNFPWDDFLAMIQSASHPEPEPIPEPEEEDMACIYTPDNTNWYSTDGVTRQYIEDTIALADMQAGFKNLGKVSAEFHNSLLDADLHEKILGDLAAAAARMDQYIVDHP